VTVRSCEHPGITGSFKLIAQAESKPVALAA